MFVVVNKICEYNRGSALGMDGCLFNQETIDLVGFVTEAEICLWHG